MRRTRELGLGAGITFAQADLLELDGGRRFDIVQSAGVLHHMDDPFEGARRVCALAKPGGFVALGLYSARARAKLKPAKALAKAHTLRTMGRGAGVDRPRLPVGRIAARCPGPEVRQDQGVSRP